MKYSIPKLPYSYEALEPYIDAKTMEIHHSKHHQAYVDKLNAVLEKYPKLADDPIESLLKNLPKLDMAEPDKNTKEKIIVVNKNTRRSQPPTAPHVKYTHDKKTSAHLS